MFVIVTAIWLLEIDHAMQFVDGDGDGDADADGNGNGNVHLNVNGLWTYEAHKISALRRKPGCVI